MTRPSPIIKGIPDAQPGTAFLPDLRQNEDFETLRVLLTHMRGHYATMTGLFENCTGQKDSLNPIDAYNKGALIAYKAIVADLDEILRM